MFLFLGMNLDGLRRHLDDYLDSFNNKILIVS